jgi:hypothetical protein
VKSIALKTTGMACSCVFYKKQSLYYYLPPVQVLQLPPIQVLHDEELPE